VFFIKDRAGAWTAMGRFPEVRKWERGFLGKGRIAVKLFTSDRCKVQGGGGGCLCLGWGWGGGGVD